MRSYELMTIHRPELAEDDVKALVADIEKALGDSGAEVNTTDVWGKRRFAYDINHLSEGYYTVFGFAADVEIVDLMDRALSLQDEVVRHKFTRASG